MTQDSSSGSPEKSSFATLRRFVKPRTPRERCEICGADLYEEHPHLLEPTSRQLVCACNECAVSVGSRSGTAYLRLPNRSRVLTDFKLDDSLWDSLLIPVGMAFFFYNSPAEKVMAYYPGPAGATESLLSLEAWEEVVNDNPVLKELQPDVEALLVNRLKGEKTYYLVPMDRCYELVGIIRTNWRGLSGGSEVWEEIGRFFDRLKAQSSQMGEKQGAGSKFSG